MKSNIKYFLYLLLFICQIDYALAQTASLLPNALQQYFDNNGKPLSAGTVTFYIPATPTLKTVWKDSLETVPWTNPIVLDAGGKPSGSNAGIYGQGTYRQLVKDRNGNIIWDAVTAPGGSGGSTPATGDGDLVGTIKPWAGIAAPNQYVFAAGQELIRVNFPDLLTAITQTLNVNCTSGSAILTGVADTTSVSVGSRVEVSCVTPTTTVLSKTASTVTLSNTSSVTLSSSAVFFPFGNGNTTTTFNVPDLRDQVIIGRPNMGGTDRGLISSTNFGIDPTGQGAIGGNQQVALIANNIPPLTIKYNQIATLDGAGTARTVVNNIDSSGAVASNNAVNASSPSTPISRIQPSISLNYIIKTTPDTNSAIATGVLSIGGMTGVIVCGSGLLCTGNIISTVNTGIIEANSNVIFYISTTGSNSNDCISNITPCLTFAGAWQKAKGYNFNGFQVTFIFAAGTYTTGINANGSLTGQSDATKIILTGNTTTPSLYVVQPTTERTVFLSGGAHLTISNVTLDGSLSSNDMVTLTGINDILIVGSNTVFGPNATGFNDINPGYLSNLSFAGTGIIINKTQNLKTATWNITATTIIVNNNTGLAIGDVVTQVTNASVPIGLAIYSRIPPFAKITNVTGTTITIDKTTIASDGGSAKNVVFTKPSGAFIQSDQKTQIFFASGLTINGVSGYLSGFVTLDQGAFLATNASSFLNDGGGVAQNNGPPFALVGPAAALNDGTDTGSGPTLLGLPGVVLSLTSATFTAGSNTIALNQADFDAVNEYATKYMGAIGYRGLAIVAANIPPGSVISSTSQISGPSGPITSSTTATTSSNVTLSVGGFIYNGGFYYGTYNAPIVLGPLANMSSSPLTHAVPVDVAGVPTWKVIPNCIDTGGNHLNYTQSTDLFSCGSSGGGSSSLVVGTTAITSGTTTRILYDNAGVLGEYTLTGTGTVAVMQTNPSLITPALGVATGTSLAIGGCTIGSDVLCTTGSVKFAGATVISAASFGLSGNISSAAWTTNGVRYKNIAATLTDTSSSGTVATAYTDVWGANTIAASLATTFTNYFGSYFIDPIAGTNITLTNKWALGADSAKIGTSNQMTVSNTGAVSINALSIITSLNPSANNTVPLGTTSLGFSALNLADNTTINWGNGTGTLNENNSIWTFGGPGTSTAMQIISAANRVNYMQISSNIAGNYPIIQATGADANVGYFLETKGVANISLLSAGGAANLAQFVPVASAVNYPTFGSAATGNPPLISAAGSDTNIDLKLVPQGTGSVYVNTTLKVAAMANAATTSAVCYNTSTFVLTFDGTIGTCTVSLLSAKDLKSPLTPKEGFDIVMAMEPWRYTMKKDLATWVADEQIGFIADFADKIDIAKPIVAHNHDGSLAGFRYEQYTAALTAAFKYLKADNDNLRIEIENIKRAINQ